MTLLVSVVVPTYRRPELLELCLHALVAQSLEQSAYEIIVADDADDPETKRQVMSWFRRTGGRAQILYAPVWDSHGSAAARNVGWRLAAGRIIAFTDVDTIARRDWLVRGLAAMADDIAAAAGRVHVPRLHHLPSDYELDASRLGSCEFVTANCFVRRDALAVIGGFDERFTAVRQEDCDLLFSLLEVHGKVVSAPGAVVIHPIRPAHWGVTLRQQRELLFDALLYKKHAQLYRSRIRRSARWDYYVNVLSLVVAVVALVADWRPLAAVASLIWLASTAAFSWRRLHGTSHAPVHIAEIAATSILIPPLAVFWRLVGAIRFRAFIA
jgi:glycosyltransferase involved in cell wall biosynthesis